MPVTNLSNTSNRFRMNSAPSKSLTIRFNQFSLASGCCLQVYETEGAGNPKICLIKLCSKFTIPFNSLATPKNSGIPINIGVKPIDSASPVNM
ncbi:hypothetical protein D3C81_2061750 [compost metagenome]